MARYCRYCGKKAKDPRDNFCYACRRESVFVDYFYRFAKKEDISETEKDIIRGFGISLIEITGILLLLLNIPALVLILLVKVSPAIAIPVYILTAILLYYMVMGFAMMRLDKRIIGKKWVIKSIMIFLGIFRSRREGIALISAAVTAPKKIAREKALYAALTHLADGVKIPDDTPKPVPEPSEWICGFCGYLNDVNRIECKSCGKTK